MSIPRDMIMVIGGMALAACGPTAAVPSLESSPEQPTSHEVQRSDGAVHTNMLRHSVRGGEVLIIDLPDEIDGRTAGSYSLLEAPALSWLVDHSFMWRTLPEDEGRHEILIRADSPADTVVVAVVVE